MSMARRKTTRMSRVRNIEPAVLTHTIYLSNPYIDPADPLAQRYYIDLNQINSLANRRFYRQGLNSAVAGFKFFNGVVGGLTINKLPNTWVMANAWKKSFAVWQRMNDAALLESESVRPRFLDFKIYMNSNHHKNGFPGNQISSSTDQPNTILGEWEPSKVIIPDNTNPGFSAERELIATGDNYPGVSPVSGFNAVSLIEGYAASRLLPQVLDPNAPGDASDADGATPENWMVATFNEGTTQDATVIDDMISENNIAPYPFENDGVNIDTMYPGGANQYAGLEIHDIGLLTATTIGGTIRLKGGNFPCGLIELIFRGDAGGSPAIQIDMIPGSHRGLLAEPMQEM